MSDSKFAEFGVHGKQKANTGDLEDDPSSFRSSPPYPPWYGMENLPDGGIEDSGMEEELDPLMVFGSGVMMVILSKLEARSVAQARLVSREWLTVASNGKIWEPKGEVPVTLLEISGNEGAVQVNGKVYSKDSSIHLNEGDEVVFNLSVKPRRMFLLHQCSYISDVTNLQNMFQLSRHCVREFYCQDLQGTSKEPYSVKETSKHERTNVYY